LNEILEEEDYFETEHDRSYAITILGIFIFSHSYK
jgi:hypothetical protein